MTPTTGERLRRLETKLDQVLLQLAQRPEPKADGITVSGILTSYE